MPLLERQGEPPAPQSASLVDPRSRYSPSFARGFRRYVHWYFGRHFHSLSVAIDGMPQVDAGHPIIIYSNHPSWWDPIVFMLLGAALFPGRRNFGPIESQALKRYPLLERLGAFGIDLDSSRGGLMFIISSQRILTDTSSILWLAAEGAFSDVRQRPALRPGLGHLARVIPNVAVVPLAIEYPFWSESRPEALCRFGEPIYIGRGRERSAAEWNERFGAVLSRTMDSLAAQSMQRSASAFRPLLRGHSGVGGVYDLWRRAKAWTQGTHFDASHGS